MVTTLHTPPTPWLESAIQVAAALPARRSPRSASTRRAAWAHVVPTRTSSTTASTSTRWPPGPGGGPPVWFGRIAPEKGTHLAIDAAALAGRAAACSPGRSPDQRLLRARDRAAARRTTASSTPGTSRTRARPRSLRRGVGGARDARAGTSRTASSSPRRWPAEPRSAPSRAAALPELLDARLRRLVAPGDVAALAARSPRRRGSRDDAARRARGPHCSLDAMVDRYVGPLRDAGARRRRVIGYYVHHQGDGHVTRAAAIAAQLGVARDRAQLAPAAGRTGRGRGSSWPATTSAPAPTRDPTAGGALHWAPRRPRGAARRGWRRSRPGSATPRPG